MIFFFLSLLFLEVAAVVAAMVVEGAGEGEGEGEGAIGAVVVALFWFRVCDRVTTLLVLAGMLAGTSTRMLAGALTAPLELLSNASLGAPCSRMRLTACLSVLPI